MAAAIRIYWLDPRNAEFHHRRTILYGLTRVPGERGDLRGHRQLFLTRLNRRWPNGMKLARWMGMPIIAITIWPYFARRFRLDFVDTIEIKSGRAACAAVAPRRHH